MLQAIASLVLGVLAILPSDVLGVLAIHLTSESVVAAATGLTLAFIAYSREKQKNSPTKKNDHYHDNWFCFKWFCLINVYS